MIALLLILAAGLVVAVKTQDTLPFLLGAGAAVFLIVFVAPHVALLGGH